MTNSLNAAQSQLDHQTGKVGLVVMNLAGRTEKRGRIISGDKWYKTDY
jgi:hypothetical protein